MIYNSIFTLNALDTPWTADARKKEWIIIYRKLAVDRIKGKLSDPYLLKTKILVYTKISEDCIYAIDTQGIKFWVFQDTGVIAFNEFQRLSDETMILECYPANKNDEYFVYHVNLTNIWQSNFMEDNPF